jgi:hypothetical protein
MKSVRCWIETRAGLTGGLILSALMLGACAPVQPWERGRLAQPQMALEADPLLTAMDAHTYSSKEAASGGIGPAGGGCGCN